MTRNELQMEELLLFNMKGVLHALFWIFIFDRLLCNEHLYRLQWLDLVKFKIYVYI